MKKIFGISLFAVLVAAPMMASAAEGDVAPTAIASDKSGLASNGTNVITSTKGKYYAGETITNADKAATASAAYVKGAYNATISAVNKVAEIADSAVKSVTTGETNGTIKVDGNAVSVYGLGSAAYTDSGAYATAAQGALADSAVQSVAEGETNGTISVDGTDVAVHGLGSAAYTASSAYATAAQGTLAESAVQSVTTGETNGTIKVDGNAVSVYGLGSAAYTDSSAYDAAGTASAAVAALGISDYAKKTGVTATISASHVPVMVNWGDTTANTTNVALVGATYVEPQAPAQQGE